MEPMQRADTSNVTSKNLFLVPTVVTNKTFGGDLKQIAAEHVVF